MEALKCLLKDCQEVRKLEKSSRDSRSEAHPFLDDSGPNSGTRRNHGEIVGQGPLEALKCLLKACPEVRKLEQSSRDSRSEVYPFLGDSGPNSGTRRNQGEIVGQRPLEALKYLPKACPEVRRLEESSRDSRPEGYPFLDDSGPCIADSAD